METFTAWKLKRKAQQCEEKNSDMTLKEIAFKQGKHVGISGREMFKFNPNLAKESNEYIDDNVFTIEREIDEDKYDGPVKEIDGSSFV